MLIISAGQAIAFLASDSVGLSAGLKALLMCGQMRKMPGSNGRKKAYGNACYAN